MSQCMPESILPFTTHSTGIQHESFIAALSVLQKTDIARLLHTQKLTFHYRCLHEKSNYSSASFRLSC